jgi:hypothetical protein
MLSIIAPSFKWQIKFHFDINSGKIMILHILILTQINRFLNKRQKETRFLTDS